MLWVGLYETVEADIFEYMEIEICIVEVNMRS